MRPDIAEQLRLTYNAWNNPPSPELPDGAGVLLIAADEIDRLRLFERFANSTVHGQVANAIDHRRRTGKWPFED